MEIQQENKKNKSLKFQFRMSIFEKGILDKNYKRYSLKRKSSLSKFLIEACLKYYSISEDKTRKAELIDILIVIDSMKDELNRIGVNLNQITKKVNSFAKYSQKIDNEVSFFRNEFKNLAILEKAIFDIHLLVLKLYQ